MAEVDFQKLLAELNERNSRIWTQWSKSLEQAGTSGNPQALYEQNLDMMEQLVGEMLDTERKMIEGWRSEVASMEQVPEPMRAMSERFCGAMGSLLDSRRRIWDGWLNQARKMSPQSMPELLSGKEGAEQMLRMWEDFYRQMQASQQQLFSALGVGPRKGAD